MKWECGQQLLTLYTLMLLRILKDQALSIMWEEVEF